MNGHSVQEKAEAAESYPHESLSAFTRCLQNEWGFLSRVLPDFQDWLWKVEESITQNFIPKLLNCDISVDERNLFSLPVRNAGLGINNPIIEAPYSLGTSKLATSHIQNAIRGNCTFNKLEHGFTVREARKLHSETVKVRNTSILNQILETSSERKVKALKRSAENKNSAWLTAKISSKDHFSLSAQEFLDAVCLRYSKSISKLPGICDGCGGEFSIQHALACKKGGLVTLRHNEIRDAVGDLASLYWKDIRREPIIREGVPNNQTTALYADLLIRGAWNPQESAAFDVLVTDTDAESYSGRSTESILRSAEQKKQKYKDACQERHISFTPLVISVDGVLGAEFNQFLKRMGEGLSVKWERKYSQVVLDTSQDLIRDTQGDKRLSPRYKNKMEMSGN